MAAYMELDEAPAATTGGPSASQDDGEELTCPSSTASQWQMVWRPDGDLSVQSMPAGYSFSVPSLPGAAPAMPFDIVRFVQEKRAGLVCDEQALARVSEQSTLPAAANQYG